MDLGKPASLMVVASASMALSQPAPAADGTIRDQLDSQRIDMPVTTAPAAFLLGAGGEQVPRASSLREFSLQFARAFDEQGKVKNATAVEIAPVLALKMATFDEIAKKWPVRLAARTTVSAATRPGTDTLGSRYALGIQTILYSKEMDEALDTFARCDESVVPAGGPVDPGQKPDTAEIQRKVLACQKQIDAVLNRWNQSTVVVGGGRTYTNGISATPNPRDSTAFWLTGSWGGSSNKAADALGYLVTGHYRRTSNANAVDTTGTSAYATETIKGINFRGGNPEFAFVAERSVASYDSSSIADRRRTLFGVEWRLKQDMYLTVAKTRDSGASAADKAVMAKVNWGFFDTPFLTKR